MATQTIPELTNYQYNELSYNSASPMIKGSFVLEVCHLLERCGFNVNNTDEYNDEIANLVGQFQHISGMSSNGILNTDTYQAMILYADKLMNDEIDDDSTGTTSSNLDESNSPHYESFFAQDRYKMFRRNRKDIKIIFGSGSIVKTIKDVFMRSVSVSVDTSGNPISETYEFIARDIKESDEISDALKYTGAYENITSSSDIEYIYPFAKSKKNKHGGISGKFDDNKHGGTSGKFDDNDNQHGGIGGKF